MSSDDEGEFSQDTLDMLPVMSQSPARGGGSAVVAAASAQAASTQASLDDCWEGDDATVELLRELMVQVAKATGATLATTSAQAGSSIPPRRCSRRRPVALSPLALLSPRCAFPLSPPPPTNSIGEHLSIRATCDDCRSSAATCPCTADATIRLERSSFSIGLILSRITVSISVRSKRCVAATITCSGAICELASEHTLLRPVSDVRLQY